MRTLLHVFSTFGIGGPQIRFTELANNFGRRYRHRIVALDGNTDAFGKLDSGLDASLLSVPIRQGKLLRNVTTIRNFLGDLRPDLLVTSNWGTIEWVIANLAGRVPHLHMEDGFGPEEANTQLVRRVWMRRVALRRSTVVLPSQTLFRIARDVWRLPRRCLIHVPNGIDCRRFRLDRDPRLLAGSGIDATLPVVGTVTSLRAEKNIQRLIDAFAQVVGKIPAQLVIVGDGPERSNLVAHSRKLGLSNRVVFTGQVSAPEKFLAAFALFALSSDTEQMPLSVLEAMAAGLPLAATDVGDVRYMLAEENHPFLVPPKASSLARAITMVLEDPARASAVGTANARRVAAVFDKDQMLASYEGLFDGERPATT